MENPSLRRVVSFLSLTLLALASAPSPLHAQAAIAISPAIRAAVDAPDRSPEDKALDAGRHPAQMLAFFDIRPDTKVAEIGAGTGYTTELLARVIGPAGHVYGVNSPFVLEKFAQGPWTARLQKPVMHTVRRLDREFDNPFPADVRDLDAVLLVLIYHDTVWMKVDRAKMNQAVFQALKPGGIYGIVDHSAVAGHGLADVETLHRIDEAVLRQEVEAAGFTLAAEGDFLRNPKDPRDWNDSPRVAGERRGTSDRFVLKFVKELTPPQPARPH